MDNLWKDLRYGFRLLFRNPGVTLVAVLSVALGIGANTAIFSTIKAFIFAPLPVEQPSQLVSIFTDDVANPGNLGVSHLNYQDLRDNNDVLSGMAAYTSINVNLVNDNEARPIVCQFAAGNYFSLLGVRALIGRTFQSQEDVAPGAGPVAVVSYGLWQRSFGGDSNVIGRNIELNHRSFTVIGVMSRDFTGTDLGLGPDLWVPLMMHDLTDQGYPFLNTRRGLFLNLIGRLKPGVSLPQAQASLKAISKRLEQDYRQDNEGRNVKLISLLQVRRDPDGGGKFLLISTTLMAVVLVVLLIACANVANLLLARAANRQREIAVRLALGATRARLIRQLLTESVMLALIGGAVGLLLASWGKNFFASMDIFNRNVNFFAGNVGAPEASLDQSVLGFTFLLTILSGVIFGLAPALQASKLDLVPTLKGEGTVGVQRGLRLNLRKLLVVAQVALSLVALVGAGLFIRSLQNAEAVNPGFKVQNILLAGVDLDREGYTEAQGRLFSKHLLESVERIPGVSSATITEFAPLGGWFARTVFPEGTESNPGDKGVLIPVNAIGAGFFRTMGIPLLRGRDFNESDQENSPRVVIISEAMANRFWPGQEAVGKRFKFYGDTSFEQVVGVAAESKVNSIVEGQRPHIYLPYSQKYAGAFTLIAQTDSNPTSLSMALRNKIQTLDPNLRTLNVTSMRDQVDRSLGSQRNLSALLIVFGLLALLLSAVGLYGVMSYSVVKRTREIGIRMAIGAQRTDVLKLILGQGLGLVFVGIALGLVAALGMTRVLTSVLFGVGSADPLTYLATSAILALVAIVASVIPALRATKISATTALRYD